MPRFGSMHSVYHFFLENSIKITGICAQGTTKRYSCTVHSRHSYLFVGRFSCEHEICPQTVRVNCNNRIVTIEYFPQKRYILIPKAFLSLFESNNEKEVFVMYPVIPESDRPSDLADDCILSPDGVNPVSKNDEVPSEKNLFDDKIAVYPVPGATLPFYFPGYPNQPL